MQAPLESVAPHMHLSSSPVCGVCGHRPEAGVRRSWTPAKQQWSELCSLVLHDVPCKGTGAPEGLDWMPKSSATTGEDDRSFLLKRIFLFLAVAIMGWGFPRGGGGEKPHNGDICFQTHNAPCQLHPSHGVSPDEAVLLNWCIQSIGDSPWCRGS